MDVSEAVEFSVRRLYGPSLEQIGDLLFVHMKRPCLMFVILKGILVLKGPLCDEEDKCFLVFL